MRNATCLDDAILGQLVEGGGVGRELRSAEEHVLECAHCLERLKKYADNSHKWPRPAIASNMSDMGELVSRLTALRPEDRTLPPDATPADPRPFEEYQPPARIGPFQIGQLLGSGGVGLVYAAEDTELRRRVAIKLLRPEHARNPVARRRFLDEARAVAALVSDHIVPIYRVGEDGELPYLAMPLLQGQSLAAVLQVRHKLPVNETVDIARQLALGLAAAHDRGLIHRDIKPANIWIEQGGRVKIVDFGLARFLASDVHLTQTGTIIGTPAYMAPEQADGDQVDHRCDLFSMGCVIYEMIAGRTPFPGRTPLAVFRAMSAGDPVSLAQLDPAVPVRLDRLVQWLVAREPERRCASAREALEELQRLDDPIRDRRWSRRGWLAAAGAAATTVAGIVAWKSPRPSTEFGELKLMPTASVWVRHGLMDPEKTCTIEGYVTILSPFHDATHVMGNTSFLVWGAPTDDRKANNLFMSVLLLTDEGERQERIGNGRIETGVRTHIAFVNNGSDFRLFVDGQPAGRKALRPYRSLQPTSSFLLGGTTSRAAMQFSDVHVSSIARYVNSFEPPSSFAIDEHTTALYRCDRDTGLIFVDSSANKHHGALYGDSRWVRRKVGERLPAEIPDAPPDAERATVTDWSLATWAISGITVPPIPFSDAGPVTLEAFVSTNVELTGDATHVLGSAGRLPMFLSAQGWAVTVDTTKGYVHLEAGTPALVGRRYHHACVFENGEGRLYVDGRLVAKRDFGPEAKLLPQRNAFFIGGSFGTIDEIRVSDVARYSGDFTPARRHEPDDATLLLFHCDEGGGDWLRDASKYRRDLRVANQKWVESPK